MKWFQTPRKSAIVPLSISISQNQDTHIRIYIVPRLRNKTTLLLIMYYPRMEMIFHCSSYHNISIINNNNAPKVGMPYYTSIQAHQMWMSIENLICQCGSNQYFVTFLMSIQQQRPSILFQFIHVFSYIIWQKSVLDRPLTSHQLCGHSQAHIIIITVDFDEYVHFLEWTGMTTSDAVKCMWGWSWSLNIRKLGCKSDIVSITFL